MQLAKLAILLAVTLTFLGVKSANSSLLTLTSGLSLDRNPPLNLIQNGSFENRPSGSGTTVLYWATGTSQSPFAVPAGWMSGGGSNAYAVWGDTALYELSAPLPDGSYGLYFGNGSPALVSPTPTFNSDGTVAFTSPPVITPGALFRPPVTLSQTVSLNTTQLYKLSFWTSGEGAGTLGGSYDHDGIFGLDITGFPSLYLAVPTGKAGGLGASHVYEFLLQPSDSVTTISFTNWGHFVIPGIGATTELVMDDVILNAIPEPSTILLLSTGLIGLLGRREHARERLAARPAKRDSVRE